MGKFGSVAKRVLFIVYLLCLHAGLIYLLLDKFVLSRAFIGEWRPDISADQGLSPTQIPTPEPETTPTPSSVLKLPPPETSPSGTKLIVPVQGVKPEQLVDTFTQARSDGRNHDAIDIPAPAGTPVLAAADGEIVKFRDSEKGGITIYQISSDNKYCFLYAHLQRQAGDIAERQFVRTGTVIGYVGDTGNAGTGNYHLHFAISAVADPRRFWEGTSINPYQVLRGEIELK